MKTFSEFLNEIAVNPDLAPPRTGMSFRPATGTIPSDDSHAVIPLVMHPKTLSYLKELGDMGAPPQAARLLRRFADQPSDGAPVAVNASNLEVSTLRDFATRMMSGSDSIFGREFGGEVKDDAIRGMSLANELLRMLERGESAASGKSTYINYPPAKENYDRSGRMIDEQGTIDTPIPARISVSIKPTAKKTSHTDRASLYSWISPSGSFYPVRDRAGETHEDWADENSSVTLPDGSVHAGDEGSLKQTGWARVVPAGEGYAKQIAVENDNRPLSLAQVKNLRDLAIEHGFDEVIQDKGRDTARVWRR
jgi:hypothetical protein